MSDDDEAVSQTKDASPAPWTVKGMPREHRDAINAAARRADMTVAAFIWDACDAKIRASRVPIGRAEAAPTTALVGHPGADLAPNHRASQDINDALAKLIEIALKLSADDIRQKQTDVLKAARRTVTARLKQIEVAAS